MRHYRSTSTGRRISAEPRLRAAPDRDRLVALVLHLADELHAHELDQHQRHIDTQRNEAESTPAAPRAGEQGAEDPDPPYRPGTRSPD